MLQNRFFKKTKTITALKDKSGKKVTTDKEILKTAQSFYQELYKKPKKKETRRDKLINSYDKKKKKSDDWQNKLKENFTEKEIYNSLKHMREDSATGSDGLPMAFYRTFWYLKKGDCTELVNYIFFEKKRNFKNNENSNYFVNPENNTRQN